MSFIDKIKNFAGVPEEDQNEEELFNKPKAQPEVDEKTEHHKKDRNYMNINATAQLQVVLVKPERFDDASDIADNLIAKRTVLLNIENVNKDVSRRLVDFLSGVAYAQGGNIKRVANGTYIITPYDVDIMGDVLDGLKTDALEF